MSEITYHVAASLDGFIAHQDGSFGGFEWDDEVVADFFAEIETFATVLMGRKTYDVGLEEGKTSPYPALRQILFSRSMKKSLDPAVELVQTDMLGFVRQLKSEGDSPIWLCGGADVASSLMTAGLIDHINVKLNPVVFGFGIPLFGPTIDQTPSELTETKTYGCGITLLRYRVATAGAPGK